MMTGNLATKKCPFCAEIILIQAIKCKHCKERISDETFEQEKQDQTNSDSNSGLSAVNSSTKISTQHNPVVNLRSLTVFFIIGITLLCLTLPFHYVLPNFTIIKKSNLSFENTIVTESDLEAIQSQLDESSLSIKDDLLNNPFIIKLIANNYIHLIDKSETHDVDYEINSNDNYEELQSEEEITESVSSTVAAINSKVFFYSSPSNESRTTSYFVLNQTAEIETEMEEFYYVTFEYKGRVTKGYVKKTDVIRK